MFQAWSVDQEGVHLNEARLLCPVSQNQSYGKGVKARSEKEVDVKQELS